MISVGRFLDLFKGAYEYTSPIIRVFLSDTDLLWEGRKLNDVPTDILNYGVSHFDLTYDNTWDDNLDIFVSSKGSNPSEVTVEEFFDIADVVDRTVVVYDDNVRGEDSDDYGDLLWATDVSEPMPYDIGDFWINVIDITPEVVRLWVDGDGIPNKYHYPEWHDL